MTEHQRREVECLEWLTSRQRDRMASAVGLTPDDRSELAASTQRMLDRAAASAREPQWLTG